MGSNHNVTRGFGVLEKFLAKKRARQADGLINPKLRSGTVVDIGCGSYPQFLLVTDFKRKIGIDGSIKTTELGENITIIKSHFEKDKLPFKDKSIDCVVTLAVFEHIDIDKVQYLLNEIYRILKKDGEFIITTPSMLAAFPLYLLSRVGIISKVEIEEHKHALSQSSVVTLLEASGFKHKNIRKGYFEFLMNMWFVAKK